VLPSHTLKASCLLIFRVGSLMGIKAHRTIEIEPQLTSLG
jgi:hypothetical protein